MKKFLIVALLFLGFFSGITVKAEGTTDLQKINGTGPVVYPGSGGVKVQIPTEYITKDREFRAVWISHLVSDLQPYKNKEQYMGEINKIFQIMQYYNMNVMIFHIRTHNNALYKSELNPVASWWKSVDFNAWDPLKWIIDECHKRGIEFHAWLNPYRLDPSITYPENNPASNPEYVLRSDSGMILNPGEPVVRQFVIDSCMEVIENYNVDAIHFDDYFYINADDTATQKKYNPENLSVADFRRKQVDLFIENLSQTIRDYNQANKRTVQLGISPTGIYKNGSYVKPENYVYDASGSLTSPAGSNTSGFSHFGDYLYCDTKKWVDNEWIDYILPQSYWSFEEPAAGYANVMDWWSAVCRYKNVNLYSGMGLYKIAEYSYSWASNTEAYYQVMYASQDPVIQGHSIFSFRHIKFAYDQTGSSYYRENMTRIRENCWTRPVLVPEVRTAIPIYLGKPTNLTVGMTESGYRISFSPLARAKFYAVYRSASPVTYAPEEVVGIFGTDDQGLVTFDDKTEHGQYYYAVRGISSTNSLGDPSLAQSSDSCSVIFRDFSGKVLKTETVRKGESATAPKVPLIQGYTFKSWDQEFDNVTESLIINALYDKNRYQVVFLGPNGTLKTETVLHGTSASAPSPDTAGYRFVSWDRDFSKVTSDLEVHGQYEIIGPKISFYADGVLIREVPVSNPGNLPEIPLKEGHDQTTPVWNRTDYTNITEDLRVDAVYTKNYYVVSFVAPDGEEIDTVLTQWGESAQAPQAPAKKGYVFREWDTDFSHVTGDMTVTALYDEAKSSCLGLNLTSLLFTFFAFVFVFFRRRH